MDNYFEDVDFSDYIKRNDKQYTDIENFEKYEFTHNIIYELAIRNKEIQKLVKDYITCWINKEIFNTGIYGNSDLKECKNKSFSLADHFIDTANLYIDYPFFNEENDLIEVWTHKYKEYQKDDEKLLKKMSIADDNKFTELFNTYEEHIQHENHNINTDPSSILFEQNECSETFPTEREDEKVIHSLVSTKLYEKNFVYKEIKNTKIKEITRHEISPIYSRPSLTSFNNTHKLKINLDLNLPKDELINFIEKLKNEHTQNTIPAMTISKLLNRDTIKSDEKHSSKASRFANMFFAYDYITQRLEEISTVNNTLQEDSDNEIKRISNNSDLTWEYKQIQIKEVRNNLAEDLAKEGYTNIAKEEYIINQLGVTNKAIEKYYEEIKPLIDEMKYKELVTGIKK